MKAVAIDAFVQDYDQVAVSSVPEPVVRADEVLVAISHAGLNYVDLLYCRGKHQNNRSLVTPPFLLGLEFSGLVVSAPQSSTFEPGDRVYGGGLGSFAERIAVKSSALGRVPDGWSLAGAAGFAATAPVSYGALVRVGRLQASDTVLIHAAAGGLGVMAVQIAKAQGATVICTVGSVDKAAVVKRLGADHVINYTEPHWERAVLDATDGRGVDLVMDSVGLVEKSIRCSSYGARIVVVGFAGREGDLEKIAANRILLKSISVLGYRYGEDGRQRPQENEAIWKGLEALIARDLIKPVVYDKSYHGLESVPVAMKDLAARRVWGKATISLASTSELPRL